MPSRKSPSQRGLEGRLARLVASMIPGTHGGRVLNASPVTPASVKASVPAVAPPAGGGAPLGFAIVSMGLGTPTSNGTPVTTSPTLVYEVGDADLDVSGGQVTYQASGAACFYIVTFALQADPTTNAVSSDVHQYGCADGTVGLDLVSIGTDLALPTSTASPVECTPGVPGPSPAPTITAKCTGGTNRSYNLALYGYYLRLQHP